MCKYLLNFALLLLCESKMGETQSKVQNNIGLPKQAGYRVINVRKNSPLDRELQPFFDFIIDATILKQEVEASSEADLSPKQILDKLTISKKTSNKSSSGQKKLQEFLSSCEQKLVSLRVLSTKYRSVRNVEFTPNRNWNGKDDLLGFETRLSKFDAVFENYFPFSNIKENSPVKKAGISQGQYLIGCKEFEYYSVSQFLDRIYEIYYEKGQQDKKITLAVYDLVNDELELHTIELERGWGEKGLLGCQFLEGPIYRFPKNINERRIILLEDIKKAKENYRAKSEMLQALGSGSQLVRTLKLRRQDRNKNIQKLKKLIHLHPIDQNKNISVENETFERENGSGKVTVARYRQLEKRVRYLEETLNEMEIFLKGLQEE